MTLQAAYNAEVEAIRSGQLSDPNYRLCGCRDGWFLTDFDTWEECPCHRGRPHPEDYDLRRPVLLVDIENADGTEYDGVIGYESDGDRVFNDGPVFRSADKGAKSLEEARKCARGWSDWLARAFPERGLKVRLHRIWV